MTGWSLEYIDSCAYDDIQELIAAWNRDVKKRERKARLNSKRRTMG